jgi:hypothetical protein
VRDFAFAKDNKNPTPATGETKTAGDKRKESAMRFLRHLSPYARQAEGAYDLYQSGGGKVTTSANGKEVELSPFEAVMRVLGFTPAKVSEAYDTPKEESGGRTSSLPPRKFSQVRRERGKATPDADAE